MQRSDAPYSALFFTYFCYIGAFSAYFGLYLESTGKTALQISSILAATQITRIFGPNVWGVLADRQGAPHRLMRWAALCGFIAFLAMLAQDAVWWLFFTLLIMQFFTSALIPLNESLVLKHLGAQRERYGPIRIWGSIGFMVAVLGLGYAFDYVALKWVGPAVALLLVGVIVAVFCLPAQSDVHVRAPSGLFRAQLAEPHVRALMVASFLMVFAHGALYTFYSIYLKDHGYAKSTIGWMWSIGVLAEIVMFALLPRLMRRWSLKGIFVTTFWLCGARFLMIALGAESLAILVVAQVLHAATFAVYHGAAVALVQRWFAPAILARALGLFTSLSYGLGGLLGSLLSGFLWERAGPQWVFTLSAVAGIIGALVVHAFLSDAPPVEPTPPVESHEEALMS